MCFIARFVHRGGLRVHVMRHRPFSRQRSATYSRAKFLVDLWNCTVASWSQSVTSSTPFLGFISANPFAVLIRLGSGFEVFLQTLARMLFGESSSRFISVGRQVDAILNTRIRQTSTCHDDSSQLPGDTTPQSAQPSRSGRGGRSILPWAFLLSGLPATRPFDFHCRSQLSAPGFPTMWVLQAAFDASFSIATSISSSLQRFEESDAWLIPDAFECIISKNRQPV